MKKKVFLSIVLIITILFAGVAYATEESIAVNATTVEETEEVTTEEEYITVDSEDIVVTSEETEDEVEETKEISGTYFTAEDLKNAVVDGNVFAAGGDLEISYAEIYGDLYVVGSDIVLENVTVYGNIFIVGMDMEFDDTIIAGNAFLVGNEVQFSAISQDLFAIAQVLTLDEEASVVREMYAMAGSIYLDGADIGSNAYLTADTLTADENVTIGDTLNYSASAVSISSEATIGSVNYSDLESITSGGTSLASIAYDVVTIVVKAVFILGFIFLFASGFIEKQKTDNTVKYIATNTLKGLGWAIVIPVVAVILLFTGLTYGLSIGLFAIYSLIFWASTSIVAVTITKNITTENDNKWRIYGQSLLVVILIAILKQIPVIKWIVTIVVALAGMGIFMNMFKREKASKKEKNLDKKATDKPKKTDKTKKEETTEKDGSSKKAKAEKEDKPAKEEKKEDKEK